MKYKLEWIEKKSPEWYIVSIGANGEITTDVSANKKDKNGIMFPNFESWMAGHEVEGDLWTSQTGKKYLFPHKPQTTQGGAPRAFGGGMGAKLMDKKNENIEKAQDNKQHGIKEAGSMSGAVNMAVAEYNNYEGDEELRPTMKWLVEKNRKILLDMWDLPF